MADKKNRWRDERGRDRAREDDGGRWAGSGRESGGQYRGSQADYSAGDYRGERGYPSGRGPSEYRGDWRGGYGNEYRGAGSSPAGEYRPSPGGEWRGGYGNEYRGGVASGEYRGSYGGESGGGYRGDYGSDSRGGYRGDYGEGRSSGGYRDLGPSNYGSAALGTDYGSTGYAAGGGSDYGTDWRGSGWGTDWRSSGAPAQVRSSRDYRSGGGGERGWFDRASDEVASLFGDDSAENRRRQDEQRELHRGRGPKGYRRSDDRIREDVNDRLTDDPYVNAEAIEVAVAEGEVTLSGTVDSRQEKRRAEDVAERVSGVGHVQNNIRVRQQSSESSSYGRSGYGTGAGSGGTAGSGTSAGSSESTTGSSSGTTRRRS